MEAYYLQHEPHRNRTRELTFVSISGYGSFYGLLIPLMMYSFCLKTVMAGRTCYMTEENKEFMVFAVMSFALRTVQTH